MAGNQAEAAHSEAQANVADSKPQARPAPRIEEAAMRQVDIPADVDAPPEYGPSLTYAQTSQARSWRFSAEQIAHMRETGNQAARRRLERLWNEERSETSSSTASKIPFLSVSDELALLTYYLVKVGQIVRAFSLPELVEATATTYVKRFYLRNTCMDFHPKNIVLTCIFLATKTENYPLSLQAFAVKLAGKDPKPEVIKENEKTVLDLEFSVSQSLSFEYSVHGAHRALYGLILDSQSLASPPSREAIHALTAASHKNLSSSRLTDAEFIYTPTQIALACIRASEGGGVTGKELVEKWLDAKEASARAAQTKAKAAREKLRADERQRLARAKVAAAQKARGKVGARAAEEEVAAAPPPPTVEFDDTLIEAQPLGMTRSDLHKVLDEIETLFKDRETKGYTGLGKGPEDMERVREIDKRQKECMNPEKVPGSRLYLKRQAEDEAVAAAKRAKKAAAHVEADDPFAENSSGSGSRDRGGLFVNKTEGDANGHEAVPMVDDDDDDDNVPVSKDFVVKPDA